MGMKNRHPLTFPPSEPPLPALAPGVTAHRIPSWRPLQMRMKIHLHLCQKNLWCAQPEPLILRQQSPPLAAAGTQGKVRGSREHKVLVPDPLQVQVSHSVVSRSRMSAGAFSMRLSATFSAPPSQARLGSAPSPGDHSSPANPHAGDEIFITYILAPPAAFRESK